jgi:hypothetical protein
MPVNGFSFMNEKFFSIIVQQPLGRACMLKFAQKKRGTLAHGWAFDLKRGTAIPAELARSGWPQNFVRRGRNRTRKPMPRGISRESRELLADSPKEKIARCPQFR